MKYFISTNKKNNNLYPMRENICNSVIPSLSITIATSTRKKDDESCQHYINKEDFATQGMTVCHPDNSTEFFPDIEIAVNSLRKRYGENLQEVRLVTHDPSHWELYYLKQEFGLIPANITDTALLARLLEGPAVSNELSDLAKRYGIQHNASSSGIIDAESRITVIAKLANVMLPKAPIQEIEIIEHTIKMFLNPKLSIDIPAIGKTLNQYREVLEKALKSGGYEKRAITWDNVFRRLLGNALADTGRTLPMKQGKDGQIPAIAASDIEMQRLCDDPDYKVAGLARLRLLLNQSAQLIPQLEYLYYSLRLTGDKLPAMLQYHKSITGRFAGGNGFNIQAIPKNSDEGRAIRKALQAPSEHVLVSCDAMQIEARILAWLCGETALNEAFAGGEDIYSVIATEIFEEKAGKTGDTSPAGIRMNLLRKVGKQLVLGLGYQMGPPRFTRELESIPELQILFEDGTLNDEICAKLVRAYRESFQNISGSWGDAETAFIRAYQAGYAEHLGLKYVRTHNNIKVELPSGRNLIYPDVRISAVQEKTIAVPDAQGTYFSRSIKSRGISYGDNKSLYGGKLVENIIQGIGRDILVATVLKLEQQGYPVIMHIHDEIICCVEEAIAGACGRAMITAWQAAPEWAQDLVLDAESKTGTNLLELK